MAKEDVLKRKLQRRALKWALRTEPSRRGEKGGPKDWLDKKLDGMLAYSLVKEKIPDRVQKVLEMHFGRGLPLGKIGERLKLSTRQVIRDMNKGLDLIADNAPRRLFMSLAPDSFQWLLGGCPHCGGDLCWDMEGAHEEEGEYCCIQCAARLTVGDLERQASSGRLKDPTAAR